MVTRHPRSPAMPDSTQQAYVYPSDGMVMFDGDRSAYSVQEADDFMRVARDDPSWDPEHTERWAGPKQTVLFGSYSTRNMPEPKSGDSREERARYDNYWLGNGVDEYTPDNDVVVDQIANSRLPNHMLGGHEIDLRDDGETDGWYSSRHHRIGLSGEAWNDYGHGDATIVHEMGHARHLRGSDPNPLSLSPGASRSTSVLPPPREDAVDHWEGVADGFADRYSSGGSRGYGASSWSDPLDKAMYDTTRYITAQQGEVPAKSLAKTALSRVRGDVDEGREAHGVARTRVAKRLMLHGMLADNPEAESAMSKMAAGRFGYQRQESHAEQIRLARHQNTAQQDPWVQGSMFKEIVSPRNVGNRTLMADPDMMPYDELDTQIAEIDRAYSSHERRFGESLGHIHNMARSQFGELGSLSTKHFASKPSRGLPDGVIPTGKWTTGM